MSRHTLQNKPPAAQPTKGFGVAASPFNQVKMELGLALILGIVLWLAAESITASIATQLLLLAGYGLISAGWLVFRVQRIVRQCNNEQLDEQKNEQNRPGTDITIASEDGRKR